MIKAKPHQEKFSALCWEVLKVKGYVYLAGKPRSGKTLTAILTTEKSIKKVLRVLIITKKNAISGWEKFIDAKELNLIHNYTITNYEQMHKFNKGDYDLVIIDESHRLGKLGKPSAQFKNIRKVCWDIPHIHLSGTAIVESPAGIYHQMAISKFSPFTHKNFYDFHKEYGDKYYIKAAGRDIAQYDKVLPTLMPKVDEFTIYMTQEDAGISKDLQAEDVLHYIELSEYTKEVYNLLQRDNVIQDIILIDGTDSQLTLVADTTMKLRTSLHMIESGVAKVEDQYIMLGNTEKIDYIKDKFGDSVDIGIMCHFIGERELLTKHFKYAKIYSSNGHAEGVDLSHLKHFIILSSDYSGSKFIQRKERIVNMEGSNTLKVHHILVKKAISEQVYKKVSKKEDFNNSTYEHTTL